MTYALRDRPPYDVEREKEEALQDHIDAETSSRFELLDDDDDFLVALVEANSEKFYRHLNRVVRLIEQKKDAKVEIQRMHNMFWNAARDAVEKEMRGRS